MGSRGDRYDNALDETIIGLFNSEEIHRNDPWRSVEAVEFATLTWVAWYSTVRLMEPLGYLSPAAFVAQFAARPLQNWPKWDSTNRGSGIPGTVQIATTEE